MPTIYELGQFIQILIEAGDHFDNNEGTAPPGVTALDLTADREGAIRDLLLTLPAASLGDAVAQLCAAFSIVDRVRGGGLEEADLSRVVIQLRRVILSVTPVVAVAAGVELCLFGGTEIELRRAKEFFALTRQTAGSTEP